MIMCPSPLCNRLLDSVRNNGLDITDGAEQVVNDNGALVVANALDILQLLINVGSGVLLGLVVAAGMLFGDVRLGSVEIANRCNVQRT